MEAEGLVETLRGQGTFICQDPNVVEKTRGEMINKLVADFIRSMRSLGCSDDSILALIKLGLGKNEEIFEKRGVKKND